MNIITKKLRKTPEMLVTIGTILGLFLVVIASTSCQNAPSAHEVVDRGDEKIATDRIKEGDGLYEARADLSKARVAVAALRQAQLADYGNYEAAWKLSRASFYVGDHTDNDAERDDMFRAGTEAGKAAVKLQPNKPEGHFWLGANYGGAASHSTLASLSSVQDIRGEMEAVIKLDEGYQGASAYLGLGRLYLQAPKVLGGDTGKAIESLLKGLKMSPNNSLMRYYLAEAYANSNRDADAKKELETLANTTPDPKHMPEHQDALAKAKKLETKLRPS
ncbi:MAG TPA: TRAP transporter TatT component family protein [Pyrinomonadaceae bacterium]|nr:TRAP transporter TatT component family protein [Pyrinomonadaceae bacterium]